MSEKIKAMRGSLERAVDVQDWLLDQGATSNNLSCNDTRLIYFVDDTNCVQALEWSLAFLFDIEQLPRWRAGRCETYFFIDEVGRVLWANDMGGTIDDERFEIKNYFKSQSEAAVYAKRIKRVFEEIA